MRNSIKFKMLNLVIIALLIICSICFCLQGFTSTNIGSKLLSFLASSLFGISAILRISKFLKNITKVENM